MDFIIDSLSIKRLIYVLLLTTVVLSTYLLFPIPQGEWLVYAALFFSLITLGDQCHIRILSILLTGCLAATLIWLTPFMFYPAFAIIYAGVVTFFCATSDKRKPAAHWIFFSISLLTLLAIFYPVPFVANLERGWNVVMGAGIAAIMQLVFWPHFQRDQLLFDTRLILRQLRLFNFHLFACFLNPNYKENLYLYERRLHEQKKHCMDTMSQLHKLVGQVSKAWHVEKLVESLTHLDAMYTLLLMCGQLREQVYDNTIYAVCVDELTAIMQEVNALFDEMSATLGKRNYHLNVIGLDKKIDALEDIYQHVLQVTAREPFVFLLFIGHLRALSKEMTLFFSSISQIKHMSYHHE